MSRFNSRHIESNGMGNKKLIIFDCDGTLVDTESTYAEITSKKFMEFGLSQYTPSYIEENLLGCGSDVFEQIIIDNLPPNTKFNKEEFLQIMTKETVSCIRNSVKPIEGIKELLEKLDVNLSVASNGLREVVLESLKSAKLINFFDERFIHTASEVKNPKPDPGLFLHTAKKRNVLPEDCLVIEDSHVGVRAAIMAGMKVVAFIREHHKNTKNSCRIQDLQPHYVVDHPSQILSCLNKN